MTTKTTNRRATEGERIADELFRSISSCRGVMAKSELARSIDDAIKRAVKKALASQPKLCPHPDYRHKSDPSGNSDSMLECTSCGLELTVQQTEGKRRVR